MTLQALLFDVDGTLADTERLGHRPAYNRAFRKLGLPFRWGPKLYRRLLKKNGGQARLLHFLDHYQPDLGDQAPVAEADPVGWARAVHRLKSRYFRRMLSHGKVPLRPGVARLIREARAAGLRIGIVTSASRATLDPVLEYSLGQRLSGEIDLVICGDEVEHKKPAPDLYLQALARLDLRAADCIAIEDSELGLEAATTAGIRTVITTNADTAHEEFLLATLVLDNLGEPDRPSRVLQGEMDGGCVTLETLRRLAAYPVAADRSATR